MLVMLVDARIVKFCTQVRYQVYQKTHVLFERQTGSSLPILEVCGFRFRQFSGFDDHIFQQISTKCHVEVKFNNTYFLFNGE